MSANIGQIVVEITANTAGLRRGTADAERILSGTSQNASAAGRSIYIAFAVMAALGVVKLIDKLEDCTQVAIDNKKALMGLESVAKAYGVSVEDAKKATQSFTQDGLLQMKSATTGMKNIISTGFNISESMKLSEALKDIAAFNSTTGDIGTAFEDATKGMRTGSIELIENIGLTQKLSAVMKAAGVDISNGIDLTNNAAQREAFYNMVLKEGEKFKGNAAKLAESQASAQAKANAAMKEAADAIGNRVLPAYSAIMGTVSNVSKSLTSIFSKNRVDEANDYAKAINKQKTEFDNLSTTYTRLATNQNKTAEETKVYKDTIAELKKQYPDFLDNIDMEKKGYEGVAEALFKINEQLNKKLLFSMKEKEMAVQQQKIIDADLKKYEATVKQNEALSKQQVLINQLSKKTEEWQAGRYVTNSEGNKEFVKFTAGDAKKDTSIKYVNGEYMKKMLAAEDEYALSTERRRIANMKDSFARENAGYDKQKADAVEEMKKIDKKYDAISGYNPIADAKAKEEAERKRKAKEEAERKAKEEAEAARLAKEKAAKEKKGLGKKESFSLDTSESTKQKLIEQEYKYKTDLANAKEEEKWRVELENKKAVAVINATAENEKKIAKIRENVENDKLSESAGKEQAQALNEALAEQLGKLELDLSLKINYHIDENASLTEAQKAADFLAEEFKKTDIGKLLAHFASVDASKSADSGDEGKEPKYVRKSLDDVTKSFAGLASVLDNDVLNALSNVANQATNIKSNISGFSAAQGVNDNLGMLSSGIGIFSSAVSIFSMVGSLFHKSTYNFDEAVKKMLAGIGEKTPNIQVKEYQKAVNYKEIYDILKKNNAYMPSNYLQGYGTGFDLSMEDIKSKGLYEDYLNMIKIGKNDVNALIANLSTILPQLAEQLGTAAGDFGSSIGSALSSATTSEELKANLYDSIYGTVKSGLINAFLAGEVMKPLLENLQQTVTIAVADGTLDAAEKTTIQGLLGNVNTEAGKFYDALEEVGLNVVDAAGQLNEAADRMDNVNRNLRLADRISTITTQTSTAGITQLAGNSSIVYDFSNANLGGMTEQQVISAVSKANRMASIRKVGV